MSEILMFLIGVQLTLFVYHEEITSYKSAIDECQKTLPRDKICKVVGVVVESENNTNNQKDKENKNEI